MQSKGFTLLESLIAIVILMILFSISVPFFKKHPRSDIHQVIERVKQHLELAKSVAVNQQAIVTVCGSSDAKTCDDHWNQGYIAFIDKTGKGIKEEGNSFIVIQRYEQALFNIQWKGFLSEKLIQFSPGMVEGRNGTLVFTDQYGNNQKLIINSAGRIRNQIGKIELN